MGYLLENSTEIPHSELVCIFQTFMLEKHQPKSPSPYVQTCFTEMGGLIVDMISLVMGFNTSEYIDEVALMLLSIFSPG